MNDRRRLRVLVTIVSLLAFLVSLWLPVIHAGGITIQGSQLLLMGWMGIVFGGLFGWLANPIYALAVLLFLFRQDRWAPPCALVALLVGLDSLRLDTWQVHEKTVPIDHFGPGFHLWIAGFVILAVGAVAVWFLSRKVQKRDAPA